MDRVRRAGSLAFVFVAAISLIAPGSVEPVRPGAPVQLAATVSWPVSTLLVSEVVTGGASASDEYAELTNAGSTSVDLTGFEVVYVTSSGGTITRKAAWATATILGPGSHLLIANSSGSYAGVADATYSGGFAATGGAIVLRPVGGVPVDAVGWGDATNAFVEGSPVAAPAPGSSVERLPGGTLGNGTDTNSNTADFGVRTTPMPQNLASAPTPPTPPTPTPTPVVTPEPSPTPVASEGPSPSPTPVATPQPTPTVEPSPEPTEVPTPTPSPSPTPSPTPLPSPDPSPTPAPSATPSPEPTASPSPTISPVPSESPAPTPTPTPSPDTAIADARSMPDGTVVTISGTLTTDLGALESARIGFVQDDSGGIAVRLDVAVGSPLPAGAMVRVTGTIGSYFSLRTLNASIDDVFPLWTGRLPVPIGTATGDALEAVEGSRLTVSGSVTAAPSSLSDGLGITIDDGSSPLRLVVGPTALAAASVSTGDIVTATGPLGQRDSSGTGLSGYRLHVTLAGEFSAAPQPTPTPTTTPAPSPSPGPTTSPSPNPSPTPGSSPSPSPSLTASPSPSGSPSPSSSPLSIAAARTQPVGTTVFVAGVVTAEAGRLGTPPLIAIADDTGGIVVRVPDGVTSPARGTQVEIRGALADPYGQLELRPPSGGFRVAGSGSLPSPIGATAATLGETVEGRLVVVTGIVDAKPTKATSGDITFYLRGAGGTIRIVADASSRVAPDFIAIGAEYEIVGIAGQRASRKGALDGYRVWPRDSRDVRRTSTGPTPGPSSSPSGSPQASPSAAGEVVTIADAVRRERGDVTVEGLVTIAPDLLDTTGRRIVIEDRTAGVEVLLPNDTAAPAVGSRIRVSGAIGRAYDAPRVRAVRITVLATGARPLPLDLRGGPTAAQEWRLVRLTGTVAEVHKLGDRWRAELTVGGTRVVVNGLAGARIPATALVVGRRATILGIVRRPYPGATDRRWSIVPRSAADVVLGGAESGAGAGDEPGTDPSAGPGAAGPRASEMSWLDVDLVDLAAHAGQIVRVGGLVSALTGDGFLLDDGTAVGAIVLTGEAAEYQPLLEPGDALNATGTVESAGDTFRVVVRDATGLVRVGDPTLDASATALPSNLLVSEPGDGDGASSRIAGGLLERGPGAIGFAGVALLTLASLAVTGLRRLRSRRLAAARIASRLASVTASPAPQA